MLIANIKNFILEKIFFKISNVNKVKGNHKALLSYSVLHFLKGRKKYIHPNSIESQVLMNSLTTQGYSVDVVNEVYKGKIDYSKYQLIIGEGYPLFNYFKYSNKKDCRIIYYASGSHPLFQTQKSICRLAHFYLKQKCNALSSLRIVPNEWGIAASLSDTCLIIGNDFTKNTFLQNGCKNVISINPPFFKTCDIEILFTEKRKKNFLWFGSYGFLHKGLDIVLDYFLAHSDLELYICGYTDRENEFWTAYSDDLKKAKNIHIIGFIDVRSIEFKNLLILCGAVILISASEGCSTALLTVIGNGGLIPIATKESGIDIMKIGFQPEDDSFNALNDAICKYLNTSVKELNLMSLSAYAYVNSVYTKDGFTNKIASVLKEDH